MFSLKKKIKDFFYKFRDQNFAKGISTLVGAGLINFVNGAIFSFCTLSVYEISYIKAKGGSITIDHLTFYYPIEIIFQCISAFFSGKIYKELGLHITNLLGTAILCLGYFTMFMSTSLFLDLLSMILGGIGTGIIFYPSTTNCYEWFKDHNGIIVGIMETMISFGSFFFAFVGEKIVNKNEVPSNDDDNLYDYEIGKRIKLYLLIQIITLVSVFILSYLLMYEKKEEEDILKDIKENSHIIRFETQDVVEVENDFIIKVKDKEKDEDSGKEDSDKDNEDTNITVHKSSSDERIKEKIKDENIKNEEGNKEPYEIVINEKLITDIPKEKKEDKKEDINIKENDVHKSEEKNIEKKEENKIEAKENNNNNIEEKENNNNENSIQEEKLDNPNNKNNIDEELVNDNKNEENDVKENNNIKEKENSEEKEDNKKEENNNKEKDNNNEIKEEINNEQNEEINNNQNEVKDNKEKNETVKKDTNEEINENKCNSKEEDKKKKQNNNLNIKNDKEEPLLINNEEKENENEEEKTKSKDVKKMLKLALKSKRLILFSAIVILQAPVANMAFSLYREIGEYKNIDIKYLQLIGSLYFIFECMSSFVFGILCDYIQLKYLLFFINGVGTFIGFIYCLTFKNSLIFFLAQNFLSFSAGGYYPVKDCYLMKVFGKDIYIELSGYVSFLVAISVNLLTPITYFVQSGLKEKDHAYWILFLSFGALNLIGCILNIFIKETPIKLEELNEKEKVQQTSK